ncbi:MAG: ABC transporter permease [Alphaproteobacteria bacterium]
MASRRRRSSPARIALNAFVGLVFVFLMLPLVVVFPISVSSAKYLQFPPPGFSWQYFEAYFESHQWLSATWRSFYVGFATAALAMALGVPLSFALVRSRLGLLRAVDKLVAAPIIAPTIVLSIAIFGLFSQLKLVGNWQGVAIAHTMLALPFVVIVVSAGLKTFDQSQEQAAIGLGASRLVAVWRITLPQIRPSLVSAAFLAFVTSFDELVVAMFLAGASMTLPKQMFDNILFEIDPTIAAVSVLQILLISVIMGVWSIFGRGARETVLTR